ncbi:beta-N-acetylglucosaminidase domain-containing protein [Streptomyces niveiscabiei]|uniref:beta-N-acetylglucosaminidase domain-containing protein n=1 Tax=Streptomyces niveiscabiei TaxID=164115 RepID=UPI0029A2A4F4|nr:beta-N-acetylglucosaminidase domain-containing protein [Streptomyces niveiscabiei]MDX3383949.1 beta-N-acetylglucosaminidase domain-containing protein [Streptomyces niveiscabiei]
MDSFTHALRRRLPLALLLALGLTLPASPPTSAAPAAPRPQVWPTPQHMTVGRGSVTVPRRVVEVLGEKTDPSARRVVEAALRDAGADEIVTVAAGHLPPPAALTVYVGGPTENADTARALRHLHAPAPTGLPAEGYVLASGRRTLALSGVDTTGTFYAAQTLRQLLTGRQLPDVTVKDWPTTRLRGVIEGFYGTPWSHAARLAQLDFYGRTKQNVYVYSPKNDAYLRARWRDEYPPAALATLKELVDRAAQNHVRFTYALSPGLSVCYSSPDDIAALVRKFASLYDIGVRSFAIPLDDISYTKWNCAADETRFGTGGAAAGTAQSYLLNEAWTAFSEGRSGLGPLEMVPTEYSDLADSPYKTALRERLGKDVVVEWTGTATIPPVITTAQTERAREVYGHPILIWDNYPVNDYVTSRLLLGPYNGREPGVPTAAVGVTANPMVQAEASKLALFTSADYLWNPHAYDPHQAFLASVRDLAGPAAEKWLRIFAENQYSSALNTTESPTLTKLIADFRASGDEKPLRAYFTAMTQTPAQLRAHLANPGFLKESSAWLDKLGSYGGAGLTALDLLLAHQQGDTEAVSRLWNRLQSERKALDAVPQQISPGVMDQFLFRTSLENAPAPGPDATFTPTSLTLKPGEKATVKLSFSQSGPAQWQLTVPEGLTATPTTGTATTATITLTAAPDATPGVRPLTVTGALPRTLPVQITDGAGTLRALTANFSGASVSSIDLSTGTGTEIKTGANPGDVTTSSDGRTAYAANQGANTVSVIDVSTGTVTATVPVGRVPAGLALTPDGKTLWVANYTDATVQPIDTATLEPGAPIKVGRGPENLTVTPDGKTLYVPNINSNTVTPVDLATNKAGTAIPVGPRPFNVVAAPDSRTVYVSNSGGSSITPIDTATNDTKPTYLVTGQAYGLTITPDGRTLWVTASTGTTATPVDTVTGAPGAPVTVGRSAFDAAPSWNGDTVYVTTADENRLVPLDTGTGKPGTPLPTGAYPLAAAVTGVPVK